LTDYHIDALRLDSVHAIFDNSDRPFLQELAETVQAQAGQLDRRLYLIAESADNNAGLIRSRDLGGYGLDAQWNDDFHHSLHVLLTGEQTGYYQDFGSTQQLLQAFTEGFVYSGQFSKYRNRAHGNGLI
jgi:maltooligosyltrehalose trehalohydrolase